MKIGIVTPAPARSRYGNRVTAIRWSRILRKLGHRVSIHQTYNGEHLDLLIALHARRSFVSIDRFHRKHPDSPIIVALTGTDLYRDLNVGLRAQKSLDLATRIVVLQPKALEELSGSWRGKTRVIFQSVAKQTATLRSTRGFNVCVIGHLRPVKDPFRAAMAARLLPASSRLRVLQVGGAMTERAATRAREEERVNPRYRWLGELPPWRVRRVLAGCRVCVLSSRVEGGANALGEAMVAGVPVLASRIRGSVGILGENYPGYFEAGDTDGLVALLTRAEADSKFLRKLREHCEKLASLFDPGREEVAWAKLLDEIFEAN
ncbi:MAG: selenoneine biosynthesis selenosugar synthase SenB [Acidobacteriota bacterium]